MISVIPLEDSKEHNQEEPSLCECNPKIEYIDPDTGMPWEGDGPLVVHNAFDARELFEQC